MSRNTVGTVVIFGLAAIGLMIVAPALLKLTFGLGGLIIMLLMWMASGVLAGRFLRGEGYGLLGDIGLGIIGGVVGSFIFGLLGLGAIMGIPFIGPILVGAVGAVIFVYIARLFNANFAR